MKKYLKWISIIILIIACVAGTCYFFFKNLTNKEHCYSYICNYLYSSSEEELNAKLTEINNQTNGRFNTHIQTKKNLNDIAFTFNTYLVSINKKQVDNTKIVNNFSQLSSQLISLNSMADEYNHKLSNSQFFDKHIGANDLYISLSNNLAFYAESLRVLNEELNNLPIDKNADIKFSMIDAYLEVVINSFLSTRRVGNVAYLENFANIDFINQHFKLENSILITKNGDSNFTSINNSFIKYYNACDKVAFAGGIANMVGTINNFADNQSSTENAVYFFKVIYGI